MYLLNLPLLELTSLKLEFFVPCVMLKLQYQYR